jgi:hypothetical protein
LAAEGLGFDAQDRTTTAKDLVLEIPPHRRRHVRRTIDR